MGLLVNEEDRLWILSKLEGRAEVNQDRLHRTLLSPSYDMEDPESYTERDEWTSFGEDIRKQAVEIICIAGDMSDDESWVRKFVDGPTFQERARSWMLCRRKIRNAIARTLVEHRVAEAEPVS